MFPPDAPPEEPSPIETVKASGLADISVKFWADCSVRVVCPVTVCFLGAAASLGSEAERPGLSAVLRFLVREESSEDFLPFSRPLLAEEEGFAALAGAGFTPPLFAGTFFTGEEAAGAFLTVRILLSKLPLPAFLIFAMRAVLNDFEAEKLFMKEEAPFAKEGMLITKEVISTALTSISPQTASSDIFLFLAARAAFTASFVFSALYPAPYPFEAFAAKLFTRRWVPSFKSHQSSA